MARKASSKKKADSSANLGFEAPFQGWQPSGARQIAKGNPQGERGGVYPFRVPPKGSANFAWVQHFIPHVALQGMPGFIVANRSMSSNQSGDCYARSATLKPKAKPQSLPRQRDIYRALIDTHVVDCMVALPAQLFYSTKIPVCLRFLTKSEAADGKRGFRDRRKQTLSSNARKLSTRALSAKKVATTSHRYQSNDNGIQWQPGL